MGSHGPDFVVIIACETAKFNYILPRRTALVTSGYRIQVGLIMKMHKRLRVMRGHVKMYLYLKPNKYLSTLLSVGVTGFLDTWLLE